MLRRGALRHRARRVTYEVFLNEAMRAFLHVLDRYTIEDLVANRTNALAFLFGTEKPTD